MKILFIDEKSIQNSIRIGLMEQVAHHEVSLIDEPEEAMAFYKRESPEMVLIDFSASFGLDALYKILEINPLQHIITLSDSEDHSELLGCDFCIEHYNKKRVVKHRGIHDLLYLIDNFSQMPCEYAHKFKKSVSQDEKVDEVGNPEEPEG